MPQVRKASLATQAEVNAIVPAAGASRRMGRHKLLLPFRGTTMLGSTVAALRAGGATQVILVHAADDGALAEWAARHGCVAAVNGRPDDGMLSSIQAGLLALGQPARLAKRGGTLLVCPGDLPLLRGATVALLLSATAAAAAWLGVPRYRGTRGHPLAIAAALAPEILLLDPDIGLRQLRQRHRQRALEVDTDDPGTVRDVDTPKDYAELTAAPSPG